MKNDVILKRWHNLDIDIDGKTQLRWFTDPIVMKYMGFFKKCKDFKSAKEAKMFCKNLKDGIFFGIYLTRGKLIGQTTLSHFNKNECEFGILIGEKEYWNQGIGTQVTKMMVKYAFEDLKMKRIILTTASKNIAGQKAYLKAGFSIASTIDDGRVIFDNRKWLSDKTVLMELKNHSYR